MQPQGFVLGEVSFVAVGAARAPTAKAATKTDANSIFEAKAGLEK